MVNANRFEKTSNFTNFYSGATNCRIAHKNAERLEIIIEESAVLPATLIVSVLVKTVKKGSCNRLIVVFCILALSYLTLYCEVVNKEDN